MRNWTRVLACAALAVPASVAGARVPGTTADGVYRFPSADIQTVEQLQNAVQSGFVRVIVVGRGVYELDAPLFVVARDDLVICGATGNAKDVVFTSPVGSAVIVEAARRITFRGVTLATTAPFGSALYLNAAPSATRESYVDDVVVDRCALKGYVGVGATVRASNLTVTRSRITLTGSGLPQQGGAGVLWDDGPGLFVGHTKFATDAGVPAVSAVLVRGAQSELSEGDRARGVFLIGNTVSGDFARGFDLADVVDARVRSNTFSFPSEITTGALPGIAVGSGRVGVLMRRANASDLTEDFELLKNRVRRGFYGAWIVNAGQGVVRSNDFRGCGGTAPDASFGDRGGALRLNQQFDRCTIAVERNDFRGLRSPKTDPAVVVFPQGVDPSECFSSESPNRVDRGRPLYVVENQ